MATIYTYNTLGENVKKLKMCPALWHRPLKRLRQYIVFVA